MLINKRKGSIILGGSSLGEECARKIQYIMGVDIEKEIFTQTLDLSILVY